MILGTLGAGYFTLYYGVWVGLLGAAVFGAVGGALHARHGHLRRRPHRVRRGDQHHRPGGRELPRGGAVHRAPGGDPTTQSPSLDRPPTISVNLSGWTESWRTRGWFLVSDLAALLNVVVSQLSLFTLVALVLIFGTGWLLWRTPFGLRLRSCGESPFGLETLGVNVYRYKFVAVTMSRALAGIQVARSSRWWPRPATWNRRTGGQGYIGLAAMIFGNWRPTGLLYGSLIGYTDAARLRSGGEVHARAAAGPPPSPSSRSPCGSSSVVLVWRRRWRPWSVAWA